MIYKAIGKFCFGIGLFEIIIISEKDIGHVVMFHVVIGVSAFY